MSIDVRVFPTSSRVAEANNESIDLGTNLVTEYNIASIINRLTNNQSFVVSTSFENNELEFIIKGYYFKLKGFDASASSWDDTEYVKISKSEEEITATISICKNSLESYQYLVDTSDSNWGDVSSTQLESLLLLKKDGEGRWYIPNSSKIIFKGYSITDLDEGEL